MALSYPVRRTPSSADLMLRGLRARLTHWAGSDPVPIVLLHGFMDTGATFQFLVDALPERRGCVAFDWRGFGGSGWPDNGYWFPDYFADLDALLDVLSPDSPAILLGHSMGGHIAMTYAGLRPERIRAVINLEGFGLPRTDPTQAPGRYREWLDQLRHEFTATLYPSVQALAALLQRRNPRLTAERAVFVAAAWTQDDGSGSGAVRLRFDPAHRRLNPVLYQRDEAIACWRLIEAPVLYLLARDSEYLSRLDGEGDPSVMAQIVPRLESHWIEDATHMLHHEHPQRLAELIEDFLTRLTATTDTGR